MSVEADGMIRTKPVDLANHLADDFESKVIDLRSNINKDASKELVGGEIYKTIMTGTNCSFEIPGISLNYLENI